MLSVVIPAFNERSSLPSVLEAVANALPSVSKEVVVVDDGSTDGTREWLRANFPNGGTGTVQKDGFTVIVLYHAQNAGKGAAVRTGLAAATGEVIVIQDADLEYDPQDWTKMYPLIAERRVADVVYGSRFYGAPHRSLYFHHYLGNRLISLLANLLYNQTLADIEVCYKMITREVKNSLHLTSNDFGIEVEITAQIARRRIWRIYEVGIAYFGRTYAEGKKINWRDGIRALWYLLKFRFTKLPGQPTPDTRQT